MAAGLLSGAFSSTIWIPSLRYIIATITRRGPAVELLAVAGGFFVLHHKYRELQLRTLATNCAQLVKMIFIMSTSF